MKNIENYNSKKNLGIVYLFFKLINQFLNFFFFEKNNKHLCRLLI